jgi:uncharacterized protein YcbX
MKLAAIARYPVKSLRGTALAHARIEPIGLVGDRMWMVVDANGRFVTQREQHRLAQVEAELTATGIVLRHVLHGEVAVPTPGEDSPISMVTVWKDTVPARFASSAADDLLSRVVEEPVRLVHMHDPSVRPVDPTFAEPDDRVGFADGFPILLTTTASLDDLNTRLSHPVAMNRFRPNIVIDGAEPWAEDGWRGVRVGEVTFRVVKPCARCVIITLDPESGERSLVNEPLMTLGSFHRGPRGGIIFGQNLIPDGAGDIRVGDPVEVF